MAWRFRRDRLTGGTAKGLAVTKSTTMDAGALCPLFSPSRIDMHADTAAAVSSLVESLKAHPEDLRSMRIYGDLPTHLIDFLADHEDDLTLDLK